MPDLPDRDQSAEEPLPGETQPEAGRPLDEAASEEKPIEPGEAPPSDPLASPPTDLSADKTNRTGEETPPGEEPITEKPSWEEKSAPTEELPSPTGEVLPPTTGAFPEEEIKTEISPKEETPPSTEEAPFLPPTEEAPPSPPEVEKPLEEPLPTAGPPPAEAEAPSPVSPPSEPPEVFPAEKRSAFDLVKKILLFILIVLTVLGLAWAVFRFVLPRVRQPKEITLTYWGLWEPNSVMGGILADWEEDHPNIKVSYSQQSPREYRERLQSALARGEGPDIFRFHNTWLPMLKNELESVPATVMDAATYERTFYPVAASSLRSGTNYLGIPLEIDTLVLFYNQDIFTAAGATPPQTWDELRQLASQLTLRDENGQIQRAGVALGATGNVWHWSDILGLMMLQNGADLTNPTGSLAEDTLTFYTIFTKTDRVWDETLPASVMAFATGRTAMFFGFSWDIFEIKNINPDLDFKIAPAPQLPGTDIAWASFWAEGVAKKSKNKIAAWEFLKFLSSNEVMQSLYQEESKIRLFGEPYSRVEMSSLLQADSMVAPFINQASKAQTWYLCSRTFDNGINDRMIEYFEDAVNAVNAGGSPEEALATAASGVAQILAQYGLGAYTTR